MSINRVEEKRQSSLTETAAASHKQLFTDHAGVSYGRDVKQYLEEARLNLRDFIRDGRESRASSRLSSRRVSNVGAIDKESLSGHVFPDGKKDEEPLQMKTYYNDDGRRAIMRRRRRKSKNSTNKLFTESA